MTALHDRHNLNHEHKNFEVEVGNVVFIKAEEKNQNKWSVGRVQQLYPGGVRGTS